METNIETRVGYKTISILKDMLENRIKVEGPKLDYLLKWDRCDKYLRDMPYRGVYNDTTLEGLYK